jgi:hypothetical protein
MLNIRTATARKYISAHDDAVDRKKMKAPQWARFVSGDVEFDKVPIRAGCSPTIFSLRRLSRVQYEHIEKQEFGAVMWREAIAFGLVGWANFPGDPSCVTEESERGPRLTDACLDAIFVVGPKVFRELGDVILGMSHLGPTSARG